MNTPFVDQCIELPVGDTIQRASVTFDELINLKYPAQTKIDPIWMFFYGSLRITAVTTKKFKMKVWNGIHPVEENQQVHTCPAGTRVLVWMVSRMGDVGITDNMTDARGYDVRVDPEYLTDWEFTKTRDFK